MADSSECLHTQFLHELTFSPRIKGRRRRAESADHFIARRNMHRISSHKDLLVWQKSVTLASKVYRVTCELPNEERYGLTRQIRRAAISVASNVAEGAARSRRAEFIHFLNIARGSLTELETQVSIALELKMLRPEHRLEEDIREIGRMLTRLIQRLVENRPVERTVRS